MGILLETALPDRRFLIRLSACRFAACLICGAITAFCFSRPALNAPLRWLLLDGLCLGVTLGWFVAGMYPLCYLSRRVEFYENGVSAEPYEIYFTQLDHVHWRQEPFRLLGLIPLPLTPRDRMICVMTPKGNRRKGRRLSVSGFYFSGLRQAFDRAYAFSVPWEFTPYRRKRKQKTAPSPGPLMLGPSVPPTAPPVTPPPRAQARAVPEPVGEPVEEVEWDEPTGPDPWLDTEDIPIDPD